MGGLMVPLVKKGSVGELRMYSKSGLHLEIVLGLVCVCVGGETISRLYQGGDHPSPIYATLHIRMYVCINVSKHKRMHIQNHSTNIHPSYSLT